MYKLYAFFDLEQFDSEVLDKCMRFLPEKHKVKVLRHRREIDRKISVASYLLLSYSLYKECDIHSPVFEYTVKGKPYLPNYPDIHFNISHCPKGCICAISDSPVGVDIQDMRPFSQDIARLCCSRAELRLLEQANDPAACFTRMWAMKESCLKMTGQCRRKSVAYFMRLFQLAGTVLFSTNYRSVFCMPWRTP